MLKRIEVILREETYNQLKKAAKGNIQEHVRGIILDSLRSGEKPKTNTTYTRPERCPVELLRKNLAAAGFPKELNFQQVKRILRFHALRSDVNEGMEKLGYIFDLKKRSWWIKG